MIGRGCGKRHQCILAKARVFFQCRQEQPEIVFPRNLNRPELSDMIVDDLRVEQNEATSHQMPDKELETHLGRIGYPRKHRFTEKRSTNRNTVQPACQLSFKPGFNAM